MRLSYRKVVRCLAWLNLPLNLGVCYAGMYFQVPNLALLGGIMALYWVCFALYLS